MGESIYTVLSTFFAAVSGIGAAISAYIAFKVFLKQGEPKIVVYSRGDREKTTFMYIRIENIGRDVATNIHFEPSRPIPFDTYSDKSKTMTSGPLVNGIPLLAPGENRDVMWGDYVSLAEVIGDEPITVSFTYYHGKKLIEDCSQIEVLSFLNTPASKPPIVVIADKLIEIGKDLKSMILKMDKSA